MPSGTIQYKPTSWREIKKIGYVDKTGVDQYVCKAVAWQRHSEVKLEHEVNLVEVIRAKNPNVEEITEIRITGAYIEGYFSTAGAVGFYWHSRVYIYTAGGRASITVDSDENWKPNSVTINIRVDLNNPVVKITRDLLCDLGYSLYPLGYVEVGQRNFILTVTYEYRGPPPPPEQLTVVVLDQDTFRPISDARVVLTTSVGDVVDMARTDRYGQATLIAPEGEYVVRVSASGYESVRKTVSVPGKYTIYLSKPSLIPPIGLEQLVPIAVVGAIALGGLYLFMKYKAYETIYRKVRALF